MKLSAAARATLTLLAAGQPLVRTDGLITVGAITVRPETFRLLRRRGWITCMWVSSTGGQQYIITDEGAAVLRAGWYDRVSSRTTER